MEDGQLMVNGAVVVPISGHEQGLVHHQYHQMEEPSVPVKPYKLKVVLHFLRTVVLKPTAVVNNFKLCLIFLSTY